MNGDLSLNQKIASALSPLVGMKPSQLGEENLKKIFLKLQDMIRIGMEPEKLQQVGAVLRVIAQEEQKAHPSFFQIMNVFESRVDKSSGLSPSLYPFFIHLSEQYDFAVKEFNRKKGVVCHLLGIDLNDPSLRSNEVDNLIFLLKEGNDLETLAGKCFGCLPHWVNGHDTILLFGKIASLEGENQDETIKLLEQILVTSNPQAIDIEPFFNLISSIAPKEKLKPFIDAIFTQERPNFLSEGVKILALCAKYADNPSVCSFLPLMLQKQENITSIEWERVAQILSNIPNSLLAKKIFSLFSAQDKATSCLIKEPYVAAAMLVKLTECCNEVNIEGVLSIINSMLIVRSEEDLEHLQDSFCRAIECLSQIPNANEIIQENFIHHFCRLYQESFHVLPPDEQSQMIAHFAKMDKQQRVDVLEGITSLIPGVYIDCETIERLGKIKPFLEFIETILPCFIDVSSIEEKQKMLEVFSKEEDLQKVARVVQDFQRIAKDRAFFSLPAKALLELFQAQDVEWRHFLIEELSSLQQMSSDEMIGVLSCLQPLHSCVSKGIYACKLCKKFFSEYGFVSIKFMQAIAVLSMEEVHSFEHYLDKLFSFYPRSGFGEEKKFIAEALLDALPSSYQMFTNLFEHIIVESVVSEGGKTIDRLVGFAQNISHEDYEKIFKAYIRGLPTEQSKLELLEAYLENPVESWEEILKVMEKIEVTRDLYNPKLLIEEIIALSKQHPYEDLLNISLPWSGLSLPNLTIERKILMLRRLLSLFSDNKSHLIPQLKKVFTGIENKDLPQFIDDFFLITEKMDYETFLLEKTRFMSDYLIISQPLVMKLLIAAAEYRLTKSLEHILVNIGKLHLNELDLISQIARYFHQNYSEAQIKEIWKGLLSNGAPTSHLSHLILKVFIAAVEEDPNKAVDYAKVALATNTMIGVGNLWPFTIKGKYKHHLSVLAPIFLRMSWDFSSEPTFESELLDRFIASAFNEIDRLFERGVTENREKNIGLTRGVLDFLSANQNFLSEEARQVLQSQRSLVDQIENIYAFYDELKEFSEKPLSAVDCQFTVSPNMTAEFNPNAFVEIMQSKVVPYGELPLIDPDILGKVFDRMQERFKDLGIINIQHYLRSRGVIGREDSLAELEDNIKSPNKEIYKASHIGIPVDEVERKQAAPAHVEKVFTILKEVMDLSDELEPKEVVSAKEYRVLLIASFLRNCPTGQKEGLFQLNLFLDQYRDKQTPKAFLSEELGVEASALDKEEQVVQKEKFIETYLRSTFALQPSIVYELMTNDNPFMRELVSNDQYFTQIVHQSTYLKNLLGKSLGLEQSITFDPYINCISPILRGMTKQEVMKIFCKHYGPRFFAGIKEALNVALTSNYEEVFNEINSIIDHVEETMWSEDYKQLTDEGVAALLRGLQILRPNGD